MNEQLKIKRAEARRDLQLALIGAVREMGLTALENPVVDFLAGLALLSYLRTQAAKSGPESFYRQLAGDIGQLTAGITVGTICTAKALGPTLSSPAAGALVSKFVK